MFQIEIKGSKLDGGQFDPNPAPDDIEAIPFEEPVVDEFAEYTGFEGLGHVFGRESDIVGHYTQQEMPEVSEQDIDNYATGAFNPHEYLKSTGSKYYAPELMGYYSEAKNAASVDAITKQLAREERATRISMSLPWWKVLPTEMAGGIASYTTVGELIAGVGLAKRGVALGKGVASMAGISGAMSGMQEFVLHQQQMTRTMSESGATMIGSIVLGGGVGALVASKAKRVEQQIADTLDPIFEDTSSSVVRTGDGGAAKVRDDISVEEEAAIDADPNLTPAQKVVAKNEKKAEGSTILKAKPLSVLMKSVGQFLPDMRMQSSVVPRVRRFADYMFNHNLFTKANENGKATVHLDAIRDTAARRIQSKLNDAFHGEYTKYAGTRFAHVKTPEGKMSFGEFSREVHKTITSNTMSSHSVPEIGSAASKVYNDLIAPIGERLVKAGILDGDELTGLPKAPLGDELWFPRMYSRGAALSMTPEQWADKFTPAHAKALNRRAEVEIAENAELLVKAKEEMVALKAKQADEIAKLKADKQPVREKKKQHTKDRAALTKKNKVDTTHQKALAKSLTDEGAEEVKGFYRTMHGKIVSSPDGITEFSGFGIVTNPGEPVIKARTVIGATKDLPDDVFDENIILGLEHNLNRQTSQLMVYEDGRFGDVTFKNIFDEIEAERKAKLVELQEAGASARKIARMNKQYLKGAKDVRLSVKAFYGIKDPVEHQGLRNLGANLKSAAVLQGLGSVILSATPEIAAALSSVGVQGYMKHAMAAMFDRKAMKELTKRQKSVLYIGDQVHSVMRMAEHGEYDLGAGGFTRGMHKAADFAVDKGFMLGFWTRGMERKVAIAVADRIGMLLNRANVAADGTISGLTKMQHMDLNRIGMDDGVIRMAKAEMPNSNKLTGGVVDLNTIEWGNQDIAKKVENVISGEVANVIIRPGTGSTPFIGKTMMGSMALQFKQFVLASTSKYFIADMQRLMMLDSRAAQKQIAFLLLGTAQWEMRRHIYGIEDEPEDWGDKLKAGYSYGGGGGIGVDILNYADQLVGSGSNAKYRGNRDVFSGLGPWLKTSTDFAKSLSGVSNLIKNGELTGEQIKAMRQTLPGNNYIFTRPLVEGIEADIRDEFN